ncbi:LysR family transcriptional regulator [Celeribacter indicus]|uniref:HTH-type transcriptional activator nahR n=1 Tax=Celeribacter indicus TaxID=1208324 RepID=A0A0B5DTI4_9RHOB|nr:LysR family transcriptional regulator [Celeribacter indicus]AJE46743.1 HTH-type transcriptional activator nahR [Celeribacter indicus]SDX05375.1 transcriptional regulator, LysR family [Celeribacter indicus]
MINPNNFDLNLLRVFDALIRERSVSAAADRLCLSQPAVSNALNRLRNLLDDPLFVRTRQGMEPTPFALRMKEPVQDGLLRIRAGISQILTFDPQQSDRTFKLIMNDVGSASFLPGIMAQLMVDAPNIDIEVCEIGHSGYEDLLDSGSADLAVGRVVLSDTFRSQFLVRTQYVAILRQGHPALGEENGESVLTREAYATAQHVIVTPAGAPSNPVERTLASLNLDRRIALRLPHATSLVNILPATNLISTLPERCRDFLTAERGLVAVRLPIPIEPNVIQQWWHRRHDYDVGHQWFRRYVADTISNSTFTEIGLAPKIIDPVNTTNSAS